MNKIMLLGDTHGNTKFIENAVLPVAAQNNVSWIYQVGDFGYWEHTVEGEVFLDRVNDACSKYGIRIVFIQGNHDKVSLIAKKYPKVFDFYQIRSTIWFAPNGTVWSPNDGKTNFIALGGAYSVDKAYRLKSENEAADKLVDYFFSKSDTPRVRADRKVWARETKAETLWFPEEEMTDDEMDKILDSVTERIDVILAHDKPISSNPMIKLMPIAECEPNQRRLQKAVNKLQPELFIHGHLHARYTDTIRSGDGTYCRVEGLGADVPNFNQLESSWEPSDAWEFLNL